MSTERAEFDEIRPYEAEEMKQAFDELLSDRQFQMILKGFAPWLPKSLRNGFLKLAFTGIKTPLDFQLRFMRPIVWYVIRKHTDGCSFDDSGLQGVDPQKTGRYTFVSNHRDIVLDSAFLDVMLIANGYPTTVEIGIGDNLLIYPWIKRLVRMNKAFTVRRGLSPKEMLRSSQLMSRYIHYAVTEKHENIWIAQREGRAKDSNDRTQDSVLKMLAMGAPDELKNPADRLRELNIVPLTISYEYDPCDYLKAQELQEKRDIPGFKKSRQDDLDNMKTGIAIRVGWYITVPPLSTHGSMSWLSCQRRSSLRLSPSVWIRISTVAISFSRVTILRSMSWKALLHMLPIIPLRIRPVSRLIWPVSWQRFPFLTRMRLSFVCLCLRCMLTQL